MSPDRAAHLDDDHVDVLGGEAADALLDLVGDVGDDLHGLAQVVAVALLGDHRRVDRPGRGVRVAFELHVDEALVVPEVEVGLTAVVGDEHLAVLERVHRARVDVDVRVELDHRDPQAPHLSSRPSDEAVSPLPSELDTPPVTKTYLVTGSASLLASSVDGLAGAPSHTNRAACDADGGRERAVRRRDRPGRRRELEQLLGVAPGRRRVGVPRQHPRRARPPGRRRSSGVARRSRARPPSSPCAPRRGRSANAATWARWVTTSTWWSWATSARARPTASAAVSADARRRPRRRPWWAAPR